MCFTARARNGDQYLILLRAIATVSRFVVTCLNVFNVVRLRIIVALVLVSVAMCTNIMRIIHAMSSLLPITINANVVVEAMISRVTPFSSHIVGVIVVRPRVFRPVNEPPPLKIVNHKIYLSRRSNGVHLISLSAGRFGLIQVINSLCNSVHGFQRNGRSRPLV